MSTCGWSIWTAAEPRTIDARRRLQPGVVARWRCIAFSRGAPPNIYTPYVRESGGDERLTNSPHSQQLGDWSLTADSSCAANIRSEVGAQAHSELWVVPVTGDRKPVPYLRAAFGLRHRKFLAGRKMDRLHIGQIGTQ